MLRIVSKKINFYSLYEAAFQFTQNPLITNFN